MKKIGDSRFDFLLEQFKNKMILEVKSVYLVKNNISLFPDAITKRGTKHLKHLMELKDRGYYTSILFVIQRKDAKSFMPNYECDPIFSKNLELAYKKGVLINVIKIEVLPSKLSNLGKIPLKFDNIT